MTMLRSNVLHANRKHEMFILQPGVSSHFVQIIYFCHQKLELSSHTQWIPAATELQRTASFGGVVPVALTNTHATADEATRGAPVTGPGIAEPFPSDARDAARPSPSAAMDTGEQAPQVSVALVVLPMGLHASTSGHIGLLYQLVQSMHVDQLVWHHCSLPPSSVLCVLSWLSSKCNIVLHVEGLPVSNLPVPSSMTGTWQCASWPAASGARPCKWRCQAEGHRACVCEWGRVRAEWARAQAPAEREGLEGCAACEELPHA